MTAPSAMVTHMFTADPSAHVFEGKIYVYPSHDVDAGIPENDLGDHFDMRDYHVLSMDDVGGEVSDHGVVLHMDDVPWVKRQMWSNDVAHWNGSYYMYFPARDRNELFRIGVATSRSPAGPFKPAEKPIEDSFSIDPSVYEDVDGTHYMYFGGIWGGQLQRWRTGTYVAQAGQEPDDDNPAIGPRIARLREDMLEFAESPREVQILDESGIPIRASDHERRFFEAAWMHRYNGRYYLSYSTGDTHLLVYATGDNTYGPFIYQGVILTPVLGWTTHHSIVEFKGNWYLFYHDCSLSGGRTHLRSVKVTELTYRLDGSIVTLDGGR